MTAICDKGEKSQFKQITKFTMDLQKLPLAALGYRPNKVYDQHNDERKQR